MGALTPEQKNKIRYHLGYPLLDAAPAVQLGMVRPYPTLFAIEQAMNLLVDDGSIAIVAELICQLDELEAKAHRASSSLLVDSAGGTSLHPLKSLGKLAPDSLDERYVAAAKRLADVFGAPLYPFSDRFRRRGPGRNVPVV